MKNIINYLVSVVDCAKRISWPSRSEVLHSSFIVLVLCVLSAAVFLVIDAVVSRVILGILGVDWL